MGVFRSPGDGGESSDPPDGAAPSALQAFRRLLADAHTGPEARVDALVALSQRTVLVASWPGADEGLRTVTGEDGLSHLPVFTDHDAMYDAAQRFAWLAPDGSLSWREIGAREAFRHALAHGVRAVTVDPGLLHAVELTRAELEPLLRFSDSSDSTGPYAAAGRVTSSLMEAIRRSSAPPPPAHMPAPPRGSLKSPPPMRLHATPKPQAHLASPPAASAPTASAVAVTQRGFPPPPVAAQEAASAASEPTAVTAGAAAPAYRSYPPPKDDSDDIADVEAAQDPNQTGERPRKSLRPTLQPPDPALDQACLDAVAECLRAFPEVEWAAAARRGGPEEGDVMAIRVDPGFGIRLPEIAQAVVAAGRAQGVSLSVVWLDEPKLLRQARRQGHIFYPWKKA